MSSKRLGVLISIIAAVIGYGVMVVVKEDENLLWQMAGTTTKSQDHHPHLGHPKRPISIVIQLKGEMGNNLGAITYGYGLKWILEDDYNITSTILLRHQLNSGAKWIKARHSVQECFPNFKDADFTAGNTNEFIARTEEQERWLGSNHGLVKPQGPGDVGIHKRLNALVRVLVKQRDHNSTDGEEVSKSNLTKANNTFISMPFLYAEYMVHAGYIIDRYLDALEDLFQYNYSNPKCCSEPPEPDETVLHLRGFTTEFSSDMASLKSKGFEELSANKTIHEMLANHSGKVAVIGRFAKQSDQYTNALLDNGLDARTVATANGEQAFCFLLRAKTLVVISQSSFGKWAAHLGNATTARIYSLKSPGRVRKFKNDYFIRYSYTTPVLTDRISWELYNTEEQDRIEARMQK